jgi:hypothetical protein
MKTFLVRLVVLAALAALTPASKLIAQGPQLAVLNEADVRQLIVRGEPADHARLSAHFTSLAQRYTADAKRHESMGQAFAGNTKLAHIATSQREHCRQLSARNLESASTLRELAAHHTKQAAGVPSDPPKGSERFERGAGATVPSDAELTRLAATAEAPADHRALEGYFTTLAGRYEQEAKESTTYAASWRSLSSKNPSASGLAANWDRLARQQRAAATEARAAAGTHKDQATTAR